MAFAGDENSSLVAEAGRNGVQGAVASGLSYAVDDSTLVLAEAHAKVQCGVLVTLNAALKPVQQGLQVLPRVLESGVCMARETAPIMIHDVQDAFQLDSHLSRSANAQVGLEECGV